MPQRIANVAVTLHRDGKRKEIKAGSLFDFTKEEIADLTALVPHALRKPVNESPVTIEGESTVVATDETTKVSLATSGAPEKATGKSKAKADAKALKEEGSAAEPGEDEDGAL